MASKIINISNKKILAQNIKGYDIYIRRHCNDSKIRNVPAWNSTNHSSLPAELIYMVDRAKFTMIIKNFKNTKYSFKISKVSQNGASLFSFVNKVFLTK